MELELTYRPDDTPSTPHSRLVVSDSKVSQREVRDRCLRPTKSLGSESGKQCMSKSLECRPNTPETHQGSLGLNKSSYFGPSLIAEQVTRGRA